MQLMNQPVIPCTFEDVMLDWACAEVLNPDLWRMSYSPLGEPLRERVCAANLSGTDRTQLIDGVRQVRGVLIAEAEITKSWNFCRGSIAIDELGSYAIIQHYSLRYGDLSFMEFATALRDHPHEGDEPVRAAVLKMLDLVCAGGHFPGRPIAVMRPTKAPLLIEGYKRSMVALLSGATSINVHFCHPG